MKNVAFLMVGILLILTLLALVGPAVLMRLTGKLVYGSTDSSYDASKS